MRPVYQTLGKLIWVVRTYRQAMLDRCLNVGRVY